MFIKTSLKKGFLFLGLITLSLTLILFGVNVYALDEFIDDYENENNIAIKNNVIRNTTFNAMELEYSSIAISWELQNCSTYIENDIIGKMTVNENLVFMDNVDRDENIWIWKDFGINYWDEFYVNFSLKNNHVLDRASNTYITIANYSYANTRQLILDNRNLITYRFFDRVGDASHRNSVEHWSGGLRQEFGNYENIVNNVWYHISMVKIGNWWNTTIYANIARTIVLYNKNIDLGSDLKWRYLYLSSSYNSSQGDRETDAYIKDVYIYTGGYEPKGYFYTTEVLSALSNSTVVLLTNYTANTGFTKVEFSNDNSTWLNHNGDVGSDILIDGYESIDLRDLNYTQLYMRFNFTRGGNSETTPRLYQIRVVTSDILSGSGAIGFIIASFILVPIILVFVWRRKRRR